ncbi:hypothetical protein [Bdellovibrio reynosensis]|uniref:Uncharacterized protein n=1 Tax=Bdellovibrio reynosensis TaxID=2835041 RepID=A0ABY4C9A7_9BACT|nr:hypothetical protein [Bdellovibrio reynosensis]UOF01512.1 hypothetical protein MNR06_00910 [Bdellovibrio reynosensis]
MKTLLVVLIPTILFFTLHKKSNSLKSPVAHAKQPVISAMAKVKKADLAQPKALGKIKGTKFEDASVEQPAPFEILEKRSTHITSDADPSAKLSFNPYKENIDPKDSPLGKIPQTLDQINKLPNLNDFNEAPSLRFLSGTFYSKFVKEGTKHEVRFAAYFKDFDLDIIHDISCGGLRSQNIAISGTIKSKTVTFKMLPAKDQKQVSVLVNIQDKIVLHIWQLDKREKVVWAKIYEAEKNGTLKDFAYVEMRNVRYEKMDYCEFK